VDILFKYSQRERWFKRHTYCWF